MIWSSFFRQYRTVGISNPDHGPQLGSRPKTHTNAGVAATDEKAMKIAAVWGCVQLIANSVASMPLTVYRENPGEDRQVIPPGDQLRTLLTKRPNQYMKARDFRTAMTVQLALWGNAYAELIRDDRGYVRSMIPLRPGRMTPVIDEDGDLTYHYATRTSHKVFAPESILHLKGIQADGITGFERNDFARETYGVALAADQFAASQFRNGGRPGGIIEWDKVLKPEQRDKLKHIYEGISAGSLHANELWILEGGMKYHALDFAADQMQMLATRLHQKADIALYFGVPDVLIGAASSGANAWPAAFEQQVLSFLTFTLQAYTDEWEAALSYSVMPGASFGVDHDPAGLIKMDSMTKANYTSRLGQNGLMTRNEGRAILGLPKVEGGDELTVQTNLTPLGDLENATGSESTSAMSTEIRQ